MGQATLADSDRIRHCADRSRSDAAGLLPTADAAQPAHGGGLDATLVRLHADGWGPSHVVHLGGSGEDFPRSVAVRSH